MLWESEEYLRNTMSPLIARLFMAETEPDNLVRCTLYKCEKEQWNYNCMQLYFLSITIAKHEKHFTE